MVRAIAKNDLPEILKIVGDLVEAGQDLNNFVRRLAGQLRNLMVLKAGITDPALLGIPGSLLPDLREQAELFSREDLLRLFDAFQKVETGMKYATQVRFQLEMGLIELAHIAQLRSLEDLIAEFASISEGSRAQKGESRPPFPGSAAAPRTERLSPLNPQARHGSAPSPGTPALPEAAKFNPADALVPEPGGAVPVRDPREFLIEIASAVGKESLESLLLTLDGARLEGEKVVLESRAPNEFSRRQIKDNMPLINQAAARIVGSRVTVVVSEAAAGKPDPASSPRSEGGSPPGSDLLDRVKGEPIIKSFLDVFPGPVKAEKIDS
jgi:DNA polymerase III gamma/tau subunit